MPHFMTPPGRRLRLLEYGDEDIDGYKDERDDTQEVRARKACKDAASHGLAA